MLFHFPTVTNYVDVTPNHKMEDNTDKKMIGQQGKCYIFIKYTKGSLILRFILTSLSCSIKFNMFPKASIHHFAAMIENKRKTLQEGG